MLKCCRFLNDPSKDVDLRKWATEGLAFLTLDAEVKEELINDTSALKSMIDVVSVSVTVFLFFRYHMLFSVWSEKFV